MTQVNIPEINSLDREFVYYKPDEVFDYINPTMLYNKHLGFTGNMEKKLAEDDPKAKKLFEQVEAIKEFIIE